MKDCLNCIYSTYVGNVIRVLGCTAPGIGQGTKVRPAGMERHDQAGVCGPDGKMFVETAVPAQDVA
jgi:hypothetical protein